MNIFDDSKTIFPDEELEIKHLSPEATEQLEQDVNDSLEKIQNSVPGENEEEEEDIEDSEEE